MGNLVLNPKASRSKLQGICILQTMFSDQSTLKLEVNNKSKNHCTFGHFKNTLLNAWSNERL